MQRRNERSMKLKRILSITYHSALDRSAPEWPECALRYSGRTPVGTGAISYCKQTRNYRTPLTPVPVATTGKPPEHVPMRSERASCASERSIPRGVPDVPRYGTLRDRGSSNRRLLISPVVS